MRWALQEQSAVLEWTSDLIYNQDQRRMQVLANTLLHTAHLRVSSLGSRRRCRDQTELQPAVSPPRSTTCQDVRVIAAALHSGDSQDALEAILGDVNCVNRSEGLKSYAEEPLRSTAGSGEAIVFS